MRFVLGLGLLAMLWGAAADGATVHHRRVHRHIITDPPQDVAVPGWYVFPGYKPIPPEENRNLDPSTRGSG